MALLKLLVAIVNKSFKIECFPSSLKTSKVGLMLIPKTEDKAIRNYMRNIRTI